MKYLYSGANAFYGKLAYRGNFITSLISLLMQMGLSMFMWLSIYKFSDSDSIAGMTISEMMVYLLIVNLLSLLFTFSPLFKLGELIHSGKLTAYLLRPINIFLQGLFEYAGENFFYLIVFVTLFVVSAILKHNQTTMLFLSLVSIVLTIVMFYLMVTAIGISGFWLVQLWPLRSTLSALYLLLGGRYFPLRALPARYDWLVYNPFSLAGNELSVTFLGKVHEGQLLINIGTIVVWIIMFFLIINWAWKKGLRHYEGVGY